MLEQKVNVTNISGKTQRIVDIGLPGNRREIVLQAGESTEIPADVWIRKMRASWLVRTEKIAQTVEDVGGKRRRKQKDRNSYLDAENQELEK
jgi:hypothetical protein